MSGNSAGGSGGGSQTVQTLPGNPNTGNLLSELNPGFKSFIPPDPVNLIWRLNPSEQVYSDAAFTTAQTVNGGTVASTRDQAGNANDLSNATTARAPLLVTELNGVGGLPALQTIDSISNPAQALTLSSSSAPLSAAMSTAISAYFVVNLNSATNLSTIIAWTGGNFTVNKGAFLVGNGGQFASLSNYGVYKGAAVFAFFYDGANLTLRFNNQEFVTPATGSLWATTKDFIIGGLATGAGLHQGFEGLIAESDIYQVAHSLAQRNAIVANLMDIYGVNAPRQLLIGGNSIDVGSGGYNVPWPTHLGFCLGTQYVLENFAVSGETTTQQAARFTTNGLPYGQINATLSGTASGVPTTTNIPYSTTAISVKKGQVLVMTSGANSGMGCQIAADSVASPITLVGAGFATAPSAADTFQVMSGTIPANKDIYIAHELTNDLYLNGGTDGPTANGGNVLTCKIWLRYSAWCLAAQGCGFNVISSTFLQRANATDHYANFEADRLLINTALRANYATFSSQLVDYANDYRFAVEVAGGNTWWLDGIHPTNTGAKVFSDYFAQAVLAIEGYY